MPPERPKLRAQVARVADGLTGALEELGELSRGIHPAILSEGGLGPALKALARRCSLPVELQVSMEARLPEPVEVAAYYVVAEALTNAAKYAQASVTEVEARARDSLLHCRSATTASAGPRPGEAPGWSAWPTGSRRWGDDQGPQPRRAGNRLQIDLPIRDRPSS